MIKMSYQTKHLSKVEILQIRKKIECYFILIKQDSMRHISGAYIQNFKFVRQKMWPTYSVRSDGQTDRKVKTEGPSISLQWSAVMSPVNLNIDRPIKSAHRPRTLPIKEESWRR